MRKILILEDEKIIALHLKGILEEAGYKVCAILNGKENVIGECRSIMPDIIICDIFLKGSKNGFEIIRNIQKTTYIPLIFLSAYSNDEVIKDLSGIRSDGYIVKPFTDEQVLATIKLIEHKYYSEKTPENLSCREKQIIFHIINGLTNYEIAKEINLSLHTIRTHRKTIYKKLNVHNMSQLIKKISGMKI